MIITDGKPRLCGCCMVNPAVHTYNRGPGGRVKVYRCAACVEHRSVSWIALRKYCGPLPKLASADGAARWRR